jgi:hypothetical protein
MNIFKLYSSVCAEHRRIYGLSGLTLTGPIYSSVEPYADQGSYQDGMAHMFWVSLVDNFEFLIALYLDIQI